MLVLLPPPMPTSLRATGANRPFFPDLLLPVEFCFVILLFCFLKFATVSFHSFMKKIAWEKQVSFRPELELEVLTPTLDFLFLSFPFPFCLVGFFFLALDRLRSPSFCLLFNLCLLLPLPLVFL